MNVIKRENDMCRSHRLAALAALDALDALDALAALAALSPFAARPSRRRPDLSSDNTIIPNSAFAPNPIK